MPGPTISGPNPIEALGSGRLTGYLGPKVPTLSTSKRLYVGQKMYVYPLGFSIGAYK